jgi:hypothetical protein
MTTKVNEGEMNVFVPSWMSEQDGEIVRKTMMKIVDAFSKDEELPAAGALSYALANLCVGVINSGVERAEGDQERLIYIFSIASGVMALMQNCMERVVKDMSDDTMTLLGEPEGNA